MNDIFKGFAGTYDHMMEDIPYDGWFGNLHQYLKDKGMEQGTICELGCGTGTMTEMFAQAGYQMIGVDVSEDMLALAENKKLASGSDILYLKQDMREFELAEPVNAIVSVCDSMNYLLEEDSVRKTFQQVRKQLNPGGYFIFDLKTAYCYRSIMGNQTWAEQDEEVSYIWENYYYEDEAVNEYILTIFRKQADSELYEKIEESHYQRAYEVETIGNLLEECGLTYVEGLGDTMKEKPTEKSERIYIIAKV